MDINGLNYLVGFIGFCIGMLVGLVIYYVRKSGFVQKEIELKMNLARLEAVQTDSQARYTSHSELLSHAQESMAKQFELLALKLYEQKSQQLERVSKTTLDQVLSPFRDQLHVFQSFVQESARSDAGERGQLKQELTRLLDLNQQLSKDASNLTDALTSSSKTQGTWGEIQLERILEVSGLTKNREYQVQVSLKTDTGTTFRPDVVVYLPHNRQIVIDSKVSLTAYERYNAADSDEDKAMQLSMHVTSLRKHVEQLAEKKYHKLQDTSIDTVFMFVPIDAAVVLAVQHDRELYTLALTKNIVLLSPSTLIPALRIVEQMWRQEKQSENAKHIAKAAGKLVDKFSGFVEDLVQIGKRLGSAQQLHTAAMKKLASGRGNLVQSARKINDMGVLLNKELPEEEDILKELPDREALTRSEDQAPLL